MKFSKFLQAILLSFVVCTNADRPCAARFYHNRSSVCVCSDYYCDTVTRKGPPPGRYISYTTSKAGLRFKRRWGYVEDINCNCAYGKHYNGNGYGKVLELRPDKTYQTIIGFGGAVTGASGINWKDLPPRAQQHLIDSYFSSKGLEYNMLRVPVAASDFSTSMYSYNEYPKFDAELTNYTLSEEDLLYKIPMIQRCKAAAVDEIKIVSAAWSAPRWMNLESKEYKQNSVSKNYYQCYANYLCKFAQLYKEHHDIDIWGMSPINEPITLVMCLDVSTWKAHEMANFITNYFGPTMRNCTAKGIKVLANDDMRNALPFTFGLLGLYEPKVYDFIDGVAVHFYFNKRAPASYLTYAMKDHPEKFLLATEASVGVRAKDKISVDLGSWDRVEEYTYSVLEELNYNIEGWIDWNLCLNKQGGPNWADNFVDAFVIVDKEKGEFLKQPLFYAFGQFTKFLPRGSLRIKVRTITPARDPEIDLQDYQIMSLKLYNNVAFITPRGTIVFIIYNEGKAQTAAVRLGDKQVTLDLDPESITTVEIPFDGDTLGAPEVR